MRVAILAQKEKCCQKRSLKSEQYYKVRPAPPVAERDQRHRLCALLCLPKFRLQCDDQSGESDQQSSGQQNGESDDGQRQERSRGRPGQR